MLCDRLTHTEGPRHLISGVTEVKGDCVLREDRNTTGGVGHADVLHYTRPQTPTDTTGWRGHAV